MDKSFNNEYEFYCPKCGDIHFLPDSTDKKCVICGFEMMETPHNYNLSQTYMEKIMELGWKSNKHLFEQNEQRLFDEIISKSPEFDINLYNNKDSIFQQKQQQQEVSIFRGKAILEEQSHQPECPTCHSKNIQRISGIERGASILGLGIFSKKINKSFKCKNCGYTW